MFLTRKPSSLTIDEFIESQSRLKLVYPSIGSTRDERHSPGFTVDHNRIRLGSGQATFDIARSALRDWQHFRFDWIELYRPGGDPAPDQTVAVLIRALGFF